MKDTMTLVLLILGTIIVLYIGLASMVWGFRNPLANRYTVYTYFPEMITFQKLDKFQPKD